MSKCKTCNGRGRWQVRETYTDGDELLTWYECGDCNGTGQDNKDGDSVFNIQGGDDDDDQD